MKPITWIQLFIFCMGMGQSRAVKAQGIHSHPQEKIDLQLNPSLMEQAKQILHFDKTVINLSLIHI